MFVIVTVIHTAIFSEQRKNNEYRGTRKMEKWVKQMTGD